MLRIWDRAQPVGCGIRLHNRSELKANFVSTVRSGQVKCTARPLHQGRTTQVWDALVSAGETDKVMAHFRCTQMILYPS